MKRKICAMFVILMALQACGIRLFAQYSDHRNQKVDSLEQALAIQKPQGKDLVNLYNHLMWGYLNVNPEKSMEYARKNVGLASQLSLWRAVAKSYNMLGMNYNYRASYDSSLYCFNQGLEAADRMKTNPKYTGEDADDERSQLYGNMANVYNVQGNYIQAIELYTKALMLFEKYGWQENQVNVYINTGVVYTAMANMEQAEFNYIKADSMAHLLGDSLLIASMKWHFGELYFKKKDYGNALLYAEKAYTYYASHPEEETTADCLNLLADIYLEGYNDDLKAEELVNMALEELNNYDMPREKSLSLKVLSSIYLKRGQWNRAEQTAINALAVDESEPDNNLELYEILAKTYIRMGKSEQAWLYFDKHYRLQASWTGRNYQSAIREMETKYETEKKETKILTLEKQKQQMTWLAIAGALFLMAIMVVLFLLWRWTVQKKRLAESRKELAEQMVAKLEQEKQLIATQAMLTGQIQERSRLARDLHDGLGSILTAAKYNIYNMKNELELEKKEAERYDKVIGLLDESMREVRRIAHHLMPDALARFGLKAAIGDFCSTVPNLLFAWYGEETRLDTKLEESFYNIAHELISNALKHSRATNIYLQILQEPDSITMTIEDDGCGFDVSKTSHGMGLTNIHLRVASLGGTIHIDSKENDGTLITVFFSIINVGQLGIKN